MAALTKAVADKPVKRKRVSMWQAFRQAQRHCGCKTSTLKTLLKAVEPFCCSETKSTKANDEQLCEDAKAVVLQLHGCVKCNEFVFSPTDYMLRCPKCQHPRFNRKKKPNEVRFLICFYRFLTNFFGTSRVVQVFWYFPLKAQLTTLLSNKKYCELLMYETRREKSPGFMSDVYDTPRWDKVAGPPTRELTRIVYQICVDGFPWSKRKHLVLCLLSSFFVFFFFFFIVDIYNYLLVGQH